MTFAQILGCIVGTVAGCCAFLCWSLIAIAARADRLSDKLSRHSQAIRFRSGGEVNHINHGERR